MAVAVLDEEPTVSRVGGGFCRPNCIASHRAVGKSATVVLVAHASALVLRPSSLLQGILRTPPVTTKTSVTGS